MKSHISIFTLYYFNLIYNEASVLNLPLNVVEYVFAPTFLMPLAVMQLWLASIRTATSSDSVTIWIISAMSAPSLS